jgi:hypothetical protein
MALDSRSLPNVQCVRDYPHAPHSHINEGPGGGCGLPEWCPGMAISPAAFRPGRLREAPDA